MVKDEQDKLIGSMVAEYRRLEQAKIALNTKARKFMNLVNTGHELLSGSFTGTLNDEDQLIVKRRESQTSVLELFEWPSKEDVKALVVERNNVNARCREIEDDLRRLGLTVAP